MRTDRLEDEDRCRWCAAKLDMSGPHGYTRMFCGKPCANAYFHKLEADALRETKAAMNRTCAHCGGPIGLGKRIETRFCSKLCRERARPPRPYVRRPHRYEGTCRACGETFAALHPAQGCCSLACVSKLGVAARRAKRAAITCEPIRSAA